MVVISAGGEEGCRPSISPREGLKLKAELPRWQVTTIGRPDKTSPVKSSARDIHGAYCWVDVLWDKQAPEDG